MHEDLAAAIGLDEETKRLERHVAERFGDGAVTDAHVRVYAAVPTVAPGVALVDGDSCTVYERPGFAAAIKAELRRLLTAH